MASFGEGFELSATYIEPFVLNYKSKNNPGGVTNKSMLLFFFFFGCVLIPHYFMFTCLHDLG